MVQLRPTVTNIKMTLISVISAFSVSTIFKIHSFQGPRLQLPPKNDYKAQTYFLAFTHQSHSQTRKVMRKMANSQCTKILVTPQLMQHLKHKMRLMVTLHVLSNM